MPDDDLEEVGPEQYEVLTGISKSEYEERYLAAARECAATSFAEDAIFDTIELQGDGLDAEVVVLFRLHTRLEGDGYAVLLAQDCK